MVPKQPRVSVIMPVYNIESYVTRAVESIQNQTLSDWELFCIDDGSTDRSGEILDRLASRDWRIEVIHTENRVAMCTLSMAMTGSSPPCLPTRWRWQRSMVWSW